MSKIIDALKARTSEPAKQEAMTPREIQIEKSNYELTQGQLADIYFSATGRAKSSELPPPVVVRVVEKASFGGYMPWIITSIAFLITALSLFSTKRVFVNVQITDDKHPYFAGAPTSFGPESPYAEPKLPADESGSNINKISLQECVFEGAAYLKSMRDKDELTLVNSSVANFARASFNFDPAINLEGAKIIFYAKGVRGGEDLAIAIKDKENIQGFDKGRLYPFPHRLTTGWQLAEISLADTAKEFDRRNLSGLRFEFGSKDTGNKPGDTIFIKDLQWIF